MRIEEPLVKAHLALWLVDEGANEVFVSVDGAEPNPATILAVLTQAGFVHTPNGKSSAKWTGSFKSARGAQIVVVSRPGADVSATLPRQRRFIAECKGEPTEKGTRAGNDKTAFYTGLGQLLMSAGNSQPIPEMIALVLPNTKRFREIAAEARRNSLLKALGISVLLADQLGAITKV